jgi:MoaA/NifB/PqqE/SkfB family radical SAM enzyme
MKAIKDYDIFGRLITNGTLLTEKMIKILVKIGWDEIVFSLDAPDKKINDYLRGKSFDRIVRAIKTLQIEKNRAKSDKPMVNIHMVLCNKNYHVLPEMFEFAYDLNCRNLLVEPIVLLAAKTKAGKELLFGEKDREAVLKYIQEATRVAHDRNFQTNVDKLGFELIESTANMKGVIETEGKEEKNPWLSMPCFQPFYHMIVRPWGTVGPCCMFDNIGEDVNKKSLRDIWFGKFFEDMRKRALEKNMPDFCSKCNPSQIQENRKIRAFLKAL